MSDRIGTQQALYCAAADVAPVFPGFASLAATEQAALIEAASEKIDEHCRRPFGFAAQLVTETFDGKNQAKLWLSSRPVISVQSVTIDGTALDNTYGDAWTFSPYKGYLIRGTGQDDNRFPPWFPAGTQNVVVQYVGGYDAIPARLTRACVWAVKWLYERGKVSGIHAEESIGDYRYKLNGAAAHDLPAHIADMLVGFAQDDAFA